MSAKSSTSNDSLLQPNLSTFNSYFPLDMYCLFSRPSSIIFTTLNIINIVLLLPLCIFILLHGLQQWRSTSSAAVSHADSFTYHLATMELIGLLGCCLSVLAIYLDTLTTFLVGFILLTFTWLGEMFFYILTCVERYLAVVHPITYLSLRKERGVRIRNITIGCVWVVCLTVMNLVMMDKIFIVVNFFLLISSLIVISFCSLSVLWVLIRSGPGEQVGRRQRVDQSKLRAFYTIVAILGVLVWRMAFSIVWAILYVSQKGNCVIVACEVLFNLPSSAVLLLLFVHRKGKLVCCKT